MTDPLAHRGGPGRRPRPRLHAQGASSGALGVALPRPVASATGRARSRAARSGTPTCWRAPSSAATSCACAGAWSASATSCPLDVAAIGRAADADPAAFLPVAYRDLDELDGFLEHLIREVHDTDLRGWLRAVFADAELRAEFRRAPCTRAGHHAYLGGLLEHTVAVGTLALETCLLHPRLNSDVLVTAALLHDLGKTREFTYGAEIGLSDEGRLVGHVASGVRPDRGARRRGAGRQAPGRRALRADPPRRRALPVRRGGRPAPAQRPRGAPSRAPSSTASPGRRPPRPGGRERPAQRIAFSPRYSSSRAPARRLDRSGADSSRSNA